MHSDHKDGITVIICCYNSADRIKKTLSHLSKQSFKGLWEIIIVDNNSVDDTIKAARDEWDSYNLPDIPLSIVTELKQGLIYARFTGINNSNYPYIIFCDDDNWLNSDYLEIANRLLKENPEYGVIGGQGIAVTDNGYPLPEWFKDNESVYAVGKQASTAGDVTQRNFVWGAGLISRKELLLKCFNAQYPLILVGRTEGQLTSGEDSEICLRIIMMGYRIYYDDKLVFRHFLPKSRLSDEYFSKLITGITSSNRVFNIYKKVISINSAGADTKLFESLKVLLRLVLNILIRKWDWQYEKQMLYLYGNINLGIAPWITVIKGFNKICLKDMPHTVAETHV